MRRRVALLLVSILLCAANVSAKKYSASGLILEVDPAHRSVEVSCQAIPGYMEAMAMTLPVRHAEALKNLKPGMLIDFTLDVREGTTYAEEIRVRKYENTAQEPMAARQLEILDAATASATHPAAVLEIGQAVPNFTLLDQNRANVSLSEFGGKVVAITFIYTRCPLPNFCFRMSNNFGVLDRRFADRMGKDLVLLSVTFDPEHDTPQVLADYARTWTKDATGWHFLTGPAADVKGLSAEFGVTAWQDEGLMTHSLHTVVIDRRGHIAANLEGNEYSAKQLGDLVQAVLTRD